MVLEVLGKLVEGFRQLQLCVGLGYDDLMYWIIMQPKYNCQPSSVRRKLQPSQ